MGFFFFFFFSVLFHVVFYSATLLSLLFVGFISCKNDISTTYFDSQEKFVTQLNLKNNDDDDDDNN